ncbi:hypothetical protein [Winogradskyella alexanderae]|uniref:Lipocalin-like domain-containing protein n=1 Tax=Winogradskyella alexanderae TaxID=2877123 RepID=A0ABS7XUU2_9FLAO|nr:hypothetical protein [Winogradskyella alexanderae]MCA0133780.1 hypothetical protein [Winogradskyella alexanderae]
MKTKFNQLILLAFFALLSFTACQNEETQITNPSEQETIVPSSVLASLMSNTTANYGAYDDVLDGASCFSIELPVTIIVSDITIVIESVEDLDELEDLFEEFEGNEDILDFLFPITIIFNDYTEIVIENQEQLENFIDDCDDDDDEEVIECIDFVYPISFSIFNADFDVIDTVSIGSDEELYNFLEELEEDDNALIVSLNYPITLVYANGETIEVNSNEELAEAIEAAEDDCDDDDEEYECNEDNIAELLVECPWDIDDEFNDFDNYQIEFNADGSLEITEGDTTAIIEGNWELTDTDDGLKLILSNLTAFEQDLGGVWIVTECDDDYLEIERGDFTIELDQDCDDDEVDCSVAEINAGIVECPWLLETNLVDTTVAVYVYFTPDGQVLNANGSETAIGAWDLTLAGGYIYLTLEFDNEYQVLNGQWKVAECEDDELYLINEGNYIYLEQECDYEEFCSDENVEVNLKECVWNVVDYNGSNDLVEFDFDFTVNYDVFVSLNGDVVQEGNWSVSSNPGGLVLNIEILFENLSGTWQIIECDDDRLKLIRENEYVIIERDCDVNVNPFECYENDGYVLEQCDDNGDGFAVFNIYEAVPDCNTDQSVIITFHTSAVGAETNTDILEGATAYTNTSTPQTVYVRVTLFENQDVFYKYPVELIVENCNEGVFDCFSNFELEECANPNGVAEFNLSANTIGLIDCPYNFTASFHETLADAESGGASISNSESYFSDGGEVYLRVESETGNFEVYTIVLNVLDCNPFECFESFDAVIEKCDEGNDGFEVFDLTIAFANCTPSADVVTYHETQTDAVSGINAIANPEAYTNITVQQVLYVRVEIENQVQVFPLSIFVEDCGQGGDCTEGDVDGILAECTWIPVSYNGDDNLINWILDFEANSQVVIMSNGETTVTATYTTSESADGVIVTFDNVAEPEIQALSGSWVVVECSAEVLQLQNDNVNLVLERTCD